MIIWKLFFKRHGGRQWNNSVILREWKNPTTWSSCRTNLHRFPSVLVINCFLGNVLCGIKNNSDILYSIVLNPSCSLLKVSFVLHWCWQLGNNPIALPNLCKILQVVFTSIFHLEFQSVELFACHTACHNNQQTFSQIKLDSLMVWSHQKIVTCLNLKMKGPKHYRKPEISFSPGTTFYSDLIVCRYQLKRCSFGILKQVVCAFSYLTW